jgi:hypothetical protein
MTTTDTRLKRGAQDQATLKERAEIAGHLDAEIAEQADGRRTDRQTKRVALTQEVQAEKRRRPTYKPDQLAAFARSADQQIRLGITFVEAAKRQGIAVPTLRKAFEQEGLEVPSRGRRPKVPRSRVKPKVDVDRPKEPIREPNQPEYLPGKWVPVFLELKGIVRGNRTLVVDYLLEGKDKKIQDAVHNLLDN